MKLTNQQKHDLKDYGGLGEPVKLCPNCKAEISNGESNWEKHCLRCGKDFCSRCVDSDDCERVIELVKKLIKLIEKDFRRDKCKSYAVGCANCQGQILLGYLDDYLALLEYE